MKKFYETKLESVFHVEALIGGIDYQGVPVQSMFLKIVQHPAYIVIQTLYDFRIVPHISLELEFRKLFSLEVSGIEIHSQGIVEFIVNLSFMRVKSG